MLSEDAYRNGSGEVIDHINDLKAENADLRKKLIACTPAIVGADPSRSSSSRCRLCSILESKVDRLSSEIDSLRNQRHEPHSSQIEELDGMLSKERHRRSRMESIIERQRSHIRFLYSKINSTSRQGVFSDDERKDLLKNDGIFDSECHIEHEDSAIPPWDIDMNDVARQLEDLDNNVQRVEASTNRLSSTTQAAFSSQSTFSDRRGDMSIRNASRSKRSVLDKLLKGSAV